MESNIPVPANISESPMDGGTRIVCSSNRDASTLGTVLAIACGITAFVVLWYSDFGRENWSSADLLGGPWPLSLWLFLVVIMITTAVAYALIAKFKNRVEIHIRPADVQIGIYPFPWGGKKSVLKSKITRLFVEEQSKTDSYGRVIKNYGLHFVDPNGKRCPLILFLRAHEALYLRRRLGEILAIDDLSVGGFGCA